MDQEAIGQLIPHRPPMLLLDRVVEQRSEELWAEKTFRHDEFFFSGHYPDFPLVPGVILCECAAQAAAVLLAGRVGDQPGVPVLTRLNDARFKRMVRPGDTLSIHVKLDEQIRQAFFLSATAKVGGDVAVRLNLACMLTNPQGGVDA